MRRVEIIKNEKEKIIYVEEKFLDSVGSDIITFLMTVLLLYITKNYLGNSWLALLMMFIGVMSMFQRYTKETVSKEELIKIIQGDKSEVIGNIHENYDLLGGKER